MKTKLGRDFSILFLGRVFQAVLALVSIRILTMQLSREDVGLTYLVASMASYFVLILISPLGMFINRKLHEWHRQNILLDIFRSVNIYFLAVSLVSVLFVLGAHYFIGLGDNFLSWQIGLLIFLNVYAVTWFQTLGPGLNMLGYRGTFVSLNILAQALGLVFSLFGIFYFEKSAFVWILGALLGQVFGAVFSWYYFRTISAVQRQTGAAKLIFNKQVLWFCLPLALATALMWGQTHFYRIIVESQVGPQALATLGVGFGVAVSIAGLIESIVTQYLHPVYYAAISQGDQQSRIVNWRKLFDGAISVYLPTTIFIICCAKFLLTLLVSSQYSDAVALVIWGALIELLRMTTNLIYIVSQSEMHTRSTIVPYGVGAVFVFIGLYFGFYFASDKYLFFVPLVLCLGAFLVCASMFLSMHKILPIRFDFIFLGRSFIYSLPLFLAFLIPYTESSILQSLSVCTIFGTYLLWVIWKLQAKLKSVS